jgi:hypothetical protein
MNSSWISISRAWNSRPPPRASTRKSRASAGGPERAQHHVQRHPLASGSVSARSLLRCALQQHQRRAVHQRQEDRLLAREVEVDPALRRVRLLGDVINGGVAVPFAGEDLQRGIQDALVALVGAGLLEVHRMCRDRFNKRPTCQSVFMLATA